MTTIVDRDSIVDSADTANVIVRDGYVFGPVTPDHESFGIEFDSANQTDLRAFFIELATRDPDLATNLNDVCRVDQLGLGWIAYFPGWMLEDEEDGEPEPADE